MTSNYKPNLAARAKGPTISWGHQAQHCTLGEGRGCPVGYEVASGEGEARFLTTGQGAQKRLPRAVGTATSCCSTGGWTVLSDTVWILCDLVWSQGLDLGSLWAPSNAGYSDFMIILASLHQTYNSCPHFSEPSRSRRSDTKSFAPWPFSQGHHCPHLSSQTVPIHNFLQTYSWETLFL